jgi:hypothetical protein
MAYVPGPVGVVTDQARSADQGLALVRVLVDEIRHRIGVPALAVLERLTLRARVRKREGKAYETLTNDLITEQMSRLDKREDALMGLINFGEGEDDEHQRST